MFELAAVSIGAGGQQVTRISEQQRQTDAHDQRAKLSQAEAFGRLFTGVGRGILFAVRAFDAVIARYRRWRRVQVTVREFSALNDRFLRDVGLFRSDIRRTVEAVVEHETVQATRATALRSTVPFGGQGRPEGGTAAPWQLEHDWRRAA